MVQVVVVERDRALGRLYLEELTEAGFDVRVRCGWEEACVSLRSEPAHVLVTDLASVGGSLETCLARLRHVHKGPVVILGPSSGDSHLTDEDMLLVNKSSDLAPLISQLRGQTLALMWSGAVTATC